MATDQTDPLPGHIIQITDPGHWSHAHLALVDGVKRWGVTASIRYPLGAVGDQEIPLRLKRDKFVIVGVAALVPPDVAEARRAAIATAQALSAETPGADQ